MTVPYYNQADFIKITKDNQVILIIDVTKFRMFCGDNICQQDENYQNCPLDCIATQSTNLETQKTQPNLKWLYVILPIILILGFLVYVEVKRKKDHILLMQKKSGQNIDALRKYISTNLQKGFSKDKIKAALVKNNYSPHEIEDAFKRTK